MTSDPAYQFGYEIGRIIAYGATVGLILGFGYGIYLLIKQSKKKLQSKNK